MPFYKGHTINLGKKYDIERIEKASAWHKDPEKVRLSKEKISKKLKNRVFSLETIEKMRKSATGRRLSAESIRKRTLKQAGENHYRWEGDNIGYGGIHQWLKKIYGKADKCEICGIDNEERMYHWALKKDCKYERKRENFMMVCVPCHRMYDGNHFQKGYIPWNKDVLQKTIEKIDKVK